MLLLYWLLSGTYGWCQSTTLEVNESIQAPTELKKVVLGDMNKDTIVDTAYVRLPKYIDESSWGDCKNGGCEVEISFSFTPTKIQLSNAVDAGIEAIGDVNQDGIQEVVVVPGWIIGCWGQYRFYSLQHELWSEFGRANRYICDEEPYVNCIVKRTQHYLTVEEDVMKNGDQAKQKKKLKLSKK